MVLSLALTILAGRYLSPEEFGFFALVATTFGLARELTDMGANNVAVRSAAGDPKSERQMLEQLLGLRLGLSIIASAACIILALSQDTLIQKVILLATGVVLLSSYISGLGIAFSLRQAQLTPSLLTVFAQLAALLLAAVLLAIQTAGAFFATVILLRELAVVAGTRQLAVKVLGYAPRANLRPGAMRPFLAKAAVVALATLCYHCQLQGGIFFVQFLRPEAEVGAFAAAFRPITPLLLIPSIMILPLIPLLSWLVAGKRSEFSQQARGIIEICIGVGTVIAVACYQSAEPLLHFLYGEKFSAGPLSAVATLQWLSVPLGCSFVLAATGTVLLADNRERWLLGISLAGFSVYVGVTLFFLPLYGHTGAAMATAVSVALLTLGGIVCLLRTIDGFSFGWTTIMSLLPAIVLFIVLQLVSGPDVLVLLLTGVMAGLALLAVWRLQDLTDYRREQARLSRKALLEVSGARPSADRDG